MYFKGFKMYFFPKNCQKSFKVSEQGVHMDQDKYTMYADQGWPVPQTTKQARSFNGRFIVNFKAYYKRFIASLGEICKPLYQLW